MFIDPLLEILWINADIPNWFAMMIELIIGLSVAGWFFKRQNDQQKKIDIIISKQEVFRKTRIQNAIEDVLKIVDTELWETFNRHCERRDLKDRDRINFFGSKFSLSMISKHITKINEIIKYNFDVLSPDVIKIIKDSGEICTMLEIDDDSEMNPTETENKMQKTRYSMFIGAMGAITTICHHELVINQIKISESTRELISKLQSQVSKESKNK